MIKKYSQGPADKISRNYTVEVNGMLGGLEMSSHGHVVKRTFRRLLNVLVDKESVFKILIISKFKN